MSANKMSGRRGARSVQREYARVDLREDAARLFCLRRRDRFTGTGLFYAH